MNIKGLIMRLMLALEKLCGPFILNSMLDRLFTPANITAAVNAFLHYTTTLARRTDTPVDRVIALRIEEAARTLVGCDCRKKKGKPKCKTT